MGGTRFDVRRRYQMIEEPGRTGISRPLLSSCKYNLTY